MTYKIEWLIVAKGNSKHFLGPVNGKKLNLKLSV